MIYPRISIIVAAYNEENYIQRCIESLLAQSYPGEMKIVVVDGNSDDKTCEIVKSLQKKNPNVKLLNNHQQFQAWGRNLALEYTTSELVAYLDGHSYASPKWLESLFNAYSEIVGEDQRLAGVGSIHLDASNTEFTLATSAAFNSYLGGNMLSSYSGKSEIQKVNTAYACLYNRKVLKKTGFYNTDFIKGEDLELNLRITKQFKYNLYINPEAITYYYKRGNLKGLYEQMISYGYWRYKVMSHHKQFDISNFLPSLFIISLLMLLILSFFDSFFAKAFVFALFFYLTTVAIESIYQSFNLKRKFIHLFRIFIAIHIGYGWGMLKAILRIK